MGIIRINNIQVYAYHGCLPEEEIIGGEYRVDVAVHYDFSNAILDDDLSKTVDYVVVSQVVQEEMKIRVKLIETVLDRILRSLKNKYPDTNKIWVKVTKIAAPIPGQVESVSVENEI